MLIAQNAQAVFLLEREQTDRHTDTRPNALLTTAVPAWVTRRLGTDFSRGHVAFNFRYGSEDQCTISNLAKFHANQSNSCRDMVISRLLVIATDRHMGQPQKLPQKVILYFYGTEASDVSAD